VRARRTWLAAHLGNALERGLVRDRKVERLHASLPHVRLAIVQ
jgi:hypothetical protein